MINKLACCNLTVTSSLEEREREREFSISERDGVRYEGRNGFLTNYDN